MFIADRRFDLNRPKLNNSLIALSACLLLIKSIMQVNLLIIYDTKFNLLIIYDTKFNLLIILLIIYADYLWWLFCLVVFRELIIPAEELISPAVQTSN